jgi:hypothetical protein
MCACKVVGVMSAHATSSSETVHAISSTSMLPSTPTCWYGGTKREFSHTRRSYYTPRQQVTQYPGRRSKMLGKLVKEESARMPTYKPPPASTSNTLENNRAAHRWQMGNARFLSSISTADPAGSSFPFSSFSAYSPDPDALVTLPSLFCAASSTVLWRPSNRLSLARKVPVNLLAHSHFV